jgi:hypothetical protein
VSSSAAMLRNHGVRAFWYLTHVGNLPSIFCHGILSHVAVARRELNHSRIDSFSIQNARAGTRTCGDEIFVLHERVPVFFSTHQPMLYVQHGRRREVAHLELSIDVFDIPGAIFTDGNAAHESTTYFRDPGDLSRLVWHVIHEPRCYSIDWKHWKAAELLLPSPVSPSSIERVHVMDEAQRRDVQSMLPSPADVVVSPSFYWIDTA